MLRRKNNQDTLNLIVKSSMEVKTFKALEAKTDRMMMAIAKNYISDGYWLVSREYNNKLGYIEINLSNSKNDIRITSIYIEKEIIIYKNKKINNRIKITA